MDEGHEEEQGQRSEMRDEEESGAENATSEESQPIR